MENLQFYSKKEEKINVLSHAIALILSVIGLILLIINTASLSSGIASISLLVYSASLIVLFSASTLYHAEKDPQKRFKYKVFDHAAIYFLIAGTYTPFCLLVLKGQIGWLIFGITWTLAIIGIVIKLFYTGKFLKISTAAYILMGWLIVFAIKPLVQALPIEALYLLFGGGLFFTVGAIIYMFKKISYTHAIFHIFVVLACICHYMAIYWYVLPLID